MIRLLFGAILLYSLASCYHRQAAVRGILVLEAIPFIAPDSSLVLSDRFHEVFYWKDLVLYKFSYRFDTMYNWHSLPSQTRFAYIIAAADSSFGLIYNGPRTGSLPVVRQRLDSLLLANMAPSVFDSLVTARPDSTIKEKEVRKVFIPRPTAAIPETQKLTFFYKKELVGVKYSMSKMDNMRGWKLYKIELDCGGAYYPHLRFTMPPRKFIVELKKIDRIDQDVMDHFHDYEARRERGNAR
jgi:hypothetical protein